MALLEVQEVVAGYHDLDILQGVSLHVDEGEIVTIIGPNGAGKSTLAKAIFGLVKIRKGDILFRGRSLRGKKPSEIVLSGMAYVPQERNVFPNLTVWENLLVGGAPLPRRELERRLEKLAELFPVLKEKGRQKAGLLSGGQRQMVAMARALILEPQLLILDEPSAGLAPQMVEAVFQQIAAINRSGRTILMVEQNARRALKMSHRGYVLDMGKNALDGTGEELLQNPRVVELYLGRLGAEVR
ncbi:MAG: ABC transporter ATP-binding protein [Clostridiales bacterium]|nr:ABC transporter ATP-binding protein [Clostridiales bacterium]